MALKVIGGGFGRTGTTSLKAALEELGFARCHHMAEVAKSAAQIGWWQQVADGIEVDWDEVFAGFESSCDWPSCTHWQKLQQHYPEAKIILSVRDEDRWYDSTRETIYPATYLVPQWLQALIPRFARLNRMIRASVWDGTFDGRFEDRDHAIRTYREHNAAVRAQAPSDRLLVFEAKDGWEPLCRFLEVPVPEIPYPHLNDASRIRRLLLGLRIAGWVLPAAAVAGFVALLW